MTEAFRRAVVDTLFPADAGLPSGTEAGVTLAPTDHDPVLTAIADRSGGEASFVAADEPTRVATLQTVEQEDGAAFERMIVDLLADYCEAESVLRAFGWRAGPPQPRGFELSPFDETILAQAKQRGRLWR